MLLRARQSVNVHTLRGMTFLQGPFSISIFFIFAPFQQAAVNFANDRTQTVDPW